MIIYDYFNYFIKQNIKTQIEYIIKVYKLQKNIKIRRIKENKQKKIIKRNYYLYSKILQSQQEMNLNFIHDNNKIHVQTQNQIAYKEQIILKQKLLKQDLKDYSQINPSLSNINLTFTQIVKDLYQHVTNLKTKYNSIRKINQQNEQQNKKKKKISIPYGTIKKLQMLKQKLISCTKIIQNQNIKYKFLNVNRQNQKKSQVKFYKQILTSYQSERQYYKKQTLKLQDRVQLVQAQVRIRSSNQNHPYTDFQSKTIQIYQMNKIQKKFNAFKKVINQLNYYKEIKNKVSQFLKQQNNKEQQKLILQDNKDQNNKINYKVQQSKIKQTPQIPLPAKNLLKSITQMSKKVNLYKRQKSQIMNYQLTNVKWQIQRKKILNEKLKKGIQQLQNYKYLLDMKNKIFYQQITIQDNKKKQKKQQNNQLTINININQTKNNKNQITLHKTKQKTDKMKDKRNTKITKTDYMIYLKQLNNQLKQYFKHKQIVYRFKKHQSSNYQSQRSKSYSTNIY